MNKLLMTVASLAVAAAPLAASAQSFDHNRNGGGDRHASQDRGSYGRGQDHGRGDYGRGWNRGAGGAAFAAGVTGLFLGAALADSRGYDYGPSYGYAQPYAYDQDYGCGWTTQSYRDRYGNLEYRQVNTCG